MVFDKHSSAVGFCLICVTGLLCAEEPISISAIYPAGGTAGTTIQLETIGKFSSWPAKCHADRDGLAVTAQKESGKWQVKISDSAVGAYWLRFYDDAGASGLKPFLISQAMGSIEKEPNDKTVSANVVKLPSVFHGRLQKKGDVDVIRVNLKKGDSLVAAVTANQQLASPFDGVLQICNHDGIVLDQSDDERGLDPQLKFTVPREGDYLLRVFGFPTTPNSTIGFAGGETFVYTMALTTGPFVDYLLPLHLQKNSVEAKTVGWNLPTNPTFPLYSHPQGRYGWLQSNQTSDPVVGNYCRIKLVDHATDYEQDDIPAEQPRKLSLPIDWTGVIKPARDVDALQVTLSKGDAISVKVRSLSLGFVADPLLTIVDPKGTTVARIDDVKKERDPGYEFTAKMDGDYQFTITDTFGHGGDRHVYHVHVQKNTPDFALEVPDDTFVVKLGASVEIPVTVHREQKFKEVIQVSQVESSKIAGIEFNTVASQPENDSADKVVLKVTCGPKTKPGYYTFRLKGVVAEQQRLAEYILLADDSHHHDFALVVVGDKK